MPYVMLRTNSLLAASLIVLGLAVLARVVVISQHAYAVLLPPMSGNDLGPTTAAVATDQTKPLLATIDTEPAAPRVASEPEVSSENPEERPPAKPEVARQMDSESQNKPTLTQTRRHRKAYNYRYSSGRLQAYWGPSVW